MRIKFLILFFFAAIAAPAFADDCVDLGSNLLEGKITALSGGLLKFRSGGIEHFYVRSTDTDFFEDFIKYRNKPLSFKKISANCRVIFVDDYNIIFETKDGRINLPRYRIKELTLKFKEI